MNESDSVVVRDQPVPEVAANPMAMLAHAVARGTSVEELKGLMELQERWEKNEARKAFVSALAAFKADPPKISKNKAVDFTSQKGRTHYKHATLDNVCDVIGSALAAQGLSFRWKTEQIEGGLIKVGCILTHQLGHTEEVWLQASRDDTGNKNNIQAIGSTVTYLQRYTLLTATGMAVADGADDDGRQGKRMSDDQVQSFTQAIAALQSEEGAGKLWQQITQATTAAGDVEQYEEFRGLMAAKRRELKKGAT